MPQPGACRVHAGPEPCRNRVVAGATPGGNHAGPGGTGSRTNLRPMFCVHDGKDHRRPAMTKLTTDQRDELDRGAFAFPKERKEPLENASHVRNAIARFNQVKGVSDAERDAAWKRIEAAAEKFGVEGGEKSCRE